ncbi:hypothetical protein C4D60_Mb03t04360 [Musa balbisiana]|uniref:Uncharacterized protein n=1 Tax=Musa balbisiana TaxID=52838 RepID=A0A4S8J7G6_MUSBA|nr:hypothetical protein C4D60_Mb03t04360 [Musa balbisiana]
MTEVATVTTPPSTLSLVARFRFRESETSDMQDSQLKYSFGAFTYLSEMSSKSPNNTKTLVEGSH